MVGAQAVEWVRSIFEFAGIAVIVGGFVFAGVKSAILVSGGRATDAYTSMRAVFGRSVLLGLELLVAADIVRTVALQPTLANLAVLGGLVVIRTFLSWALTVEIEGRWPWQQGAGDTAR